MKAIRVILFILLNAIFFSACKVGKQASDISKLQAINLDSVFNTKLSSARILYEDSVQTIALHAFRELKSMSTIIGVGDIMMGTNYPSEDYLPPNNGKFLLAEVKDILSDADVTFGNLEGVILNEGGDPKNCSNPDACYLFRSPEGYASHLIDAGFDVVSLANNHAGDFGTPGRLSTMKVLDSLGIHYAGLLSHPYKTFFQNGLKYGIAAFSPNTGTVSINDIENAKKIVQHLDSLVDIVIVSFHGGAEGKKYQHITRQTEYFYGENRGNVYGFAHQLIDVGADVVFGHGPHVTRAIEVYRQKFIAYSLGNFCTYARFNLRGENGIAPIVKVHVDKEGNFIKGRIIPIIQTGEGGPKIDPELKAITIIKDLTRTDFPESELVITDLGEIYLPFQGHALLNDNETVTD